MGIRINGTLAPIPQPLEVTYDPARGQVVTQKWESAGRGLGGIADLYRAARIAYRFQLSDAVSSLVAEASGSQLGVADAACDNWQILCNEIQKDIKELPALAAKQASYPDSFRIVLRDVNNFLDGQPQVTTPTVNPGSLPETAFLLDMLCKGQTHFALSQYVLRHTTTVSNAYGANVADRNVGRVYTTEQLLTEVCDTSLWVYPLPGRLVYKLQNIPAPLPQANYLWGWRKLGSTETTSASNRVEISTEYWLEQWHILPYPPVTTL